MIVDKVIKHLKENTEHVVHLDTNLFSHLYGTYLILKDQMQKPDYLCLAGLMHSVYVRKDLDRRSFRKISI